MEATELRVGNLVLDDIILEVDLDFFHDVVKGGFRLEEIEPIPLTEGWLERFGFVIDSDEDHVLGKFAAKKYKGDDWFTFSMNYSDSPVDWGPLAHIKHVHQLQNLFHALTGEELMLKESGSKS